MFREHGDVFNCATLRNLKAKVNAQIDKADDRKEMLLKTSNKQ
jgi:hypothetical protein